MADVITRFKLETTQFDSKLRDASKGLSDVVKQASLAGNEFARFTQKNVEAARAFGNIATSATNSKDKVKELVGAFNDVAKQYNILTKEQQQSDFGKALAESMTTLKGRIAEAKAEMNSTGGVLEHLAKKITVNFDAIKLFNAGLTAAKAALDVAKDAFFASEDNVDEWGRTIAGAQGLYEGFLTAINNGDINGYLSRMDEIVKAAREAYNALDTLQTMKTIQSPGYAKQEAENVRMRTMLMTGKWISAADGRVSPLGLKDGDKLSPEMMRVIERQLQGGMSKIASLTKNEIGQTGKAINAYYNSLAKQNGMSLSEFRHGTSSWESFSQKMAGYEAYKKWDAQARAEFARQGGQGSVNFDKSNPYAEYRKWGTFRVDKMGENSYNDLVNLIKQQQQQQSHLYSTMGQAYRTMNRINGVSVKDIMGGGGSGGGGGRSGGGAGSFDINRIAFNPPSDTDKLKPSDYAEVPSVWAMFGKEIGKSLMEGIEDPMSNLQVDDFIKSYQAVEDQIKDMNNALAQQKMAYNLAGQAAQNFGAALQSIDDPAAKAAGQVVSAIASIALGFAMASSSANTAGTGWGWLAWLGAGMAAMATTISTIHSLTGYAQGGMIKGNSYSGDNVGGLVDGSHLVGLNAGEIVLNQAGQSNVAHALQGGAFGGMRLSARLDGKDLLLSIDRTGQTLGYGQLVFFH